MISFTINYWLVNGTNQVETTNGFKDELFGFTAKPAKTVSWTVNYYLGQEHPDRLAFHRLRPRSGSARTYVSPQSVPLPMAALTSSTAMQLGRQTEADACCWKAITTSSVPGETPLPANPPRPLT